MGGGGGPSGYTTTTSNSVPWNSGNLSEIQNSATDLMRNHPYTAYEGQTLAAPNNLTIGGLENAGNYGRLLGDTVAPATPEAQLSALTNNTWLSGGGGNSFAMPFFDTLNSVMGGGNPSQQSIDSLMGVGTGTAAQSLSDTASGKYLGANPFLDAQYGAAADPVTRAYMTAVAPRTDSDMAAANRFNSGGTAGAQSVNQQNLGKTLGDMGASFYGDAYNRERALQTQAAGQLGSLQTGAYGAAGQLANQGTGITTTAANSALDAWNNLLKTQQQSISMTPNLSNMYAQDFQSSVNAGNQIQGFDQAALSDAASRFYSQQQAPWSTVSSAANIVGGAIPGMTQQQQPYFTPSPFSQIMTGATQGLGLASSLMGGGK